MNNFKKFIAIPFLALSIFSQVQAQENRDFSDVNIGLQSYVPIRFFQEHKLVNGYEDGTFHPDEPINRAEAVTFIQRTVLGFDEYAKNPTVNNEILKAAKAPFSDVPMDYWAAGSIEKAIEQKMIDGNAKKFHPEKPINLAEALKMILQAEAIKNPKLNFDIPKKELFADVNGNEWFAGYVKIAQDRGLLRFGMSNRINPDQAVTRGYFVELIYRLLKTRDANRFFGKATFYSDFFEGRGTSNGEKFTQNGFTAAHKTLPFNTNVRVTNLKNGQHVDVRINDRGPFTISMDLDLTSTAFSQIASTREGIVPVQYEILP